jgi:quinol-cytochrome oxidoreductase complex cytochrome b subunit
MVPGFCLRCWVDSRIRDKSNLPRQLPPSISTETYVRSLSHTHIPHTYTTKSFRTIQLPQSHQFFLFSNCLLSSSILVPFMAIFFHICRLLHNERHGRKRKKKSTAHKIWFPYNEGAHAADTHGSFVVVIAIAAAAFTHTVNRTNNGAVINFFHISRWKYRFHREKYLHCHTRPQRTLRILFV